MNRTENGHSVSRRSVLGGALLGAAGMALRDVPVLWALPAGAAKPAPGKQARARSVIQIWMWGGPSHLDTFDPKPQAG